MQISGSMGSKRVCYICKRKFRRFIKYRGGWKDVSVFIRKLQLTGSDLDHFACPYCHSHDRERHLFMYFDKLNIWGMMENASILHFAPEGHLSVKIGQSSPIKYIKADINPANAGIRRIDATDIPFEDAAFDMLICNHVLEHIPDYTKALKEIFRVMKPGGIVILQTPYSNLLHMNFEDGGIDTDEKRMFFYGQEDHVRVFGKNQFLKSVAETGFMTEIISHSHFFSDQEAYVYGVNRDEDLIRLRRPQS